MWYIILNKLDFRKICFLCWTKADCNKSDNSACEEKQELVDRRGRLEVGHLGRNVLALDTQLILILMLSYMPHSPF